MEPDKTRSQAFDDKILKGIAEHGWYVIMVHATDYSPSFAYTVGLWKNYGQPEFIMFGLTPDIMHGILNVAGEMVKDGNVFIPDIRYDSFLEGYKVHILNVDPGSIHDYFGYAIWFNKAADFPGLEIVWPDTNGRFPWEDDFQDVFSGRQLLLDRNVSFKFSEPRDLGIFTTRQWLEAKQPILEVVHDEDGDWQFLTGDQLEEE